MVDSNQTKTWFEKIVPQKLLSRGIYTFEINSK